MTTLLEQAFKKAAALPPSEQDVLAARIFAELEAEDDFDKAIASTAGRLTELANKALRDFHEGRTEVLNPDAL